MPGYLEDRTSVVFDEECYVDYFSVGFKSFDGKVRIFEMYDGCPLDKKGIARIVRTYRLIGFNSWNYDIPMLLYAMAGASNGELKRASDDLIVGGTPRWVMMERLGLKEPDFLDHVDLMQVSPGSPQMPSLKIYAGRLHSKRMQELPIEVDARIGPNERQVMLAYHENDLDVTIDLANELKTQVNLRTIMSREYGVDVRSKSDAQVAEAVIKKELERALGRKLYAPDIESGSFYYRVPSYVKFETLQMQAALEKIRTTKVHVTHAGTVECPELRALTVTINGRSYQMGLGGLHSQEANISHYSDDRVVLKDRDVTSYYPRSILLQGMTPKHLGPAFLRVYEGIFKRRIAAKKSIGTIGKKINEIDARIAEVKKRIAEIERAQSNVPS
jgi:hypothetical protein